MGWREWWCGEQAQQTGSLRQRTSWMELVSAPGSFLRLFSVAENNYGLSQAKLEPGLDIELLWGSIWRPLQKYYLLSTAEIMFWFTSPCLFCYHLGCKHSDVVHVTELFSVAVVRHFSWPGMKLKLQTLAGIWGSESKTQLCCFLVSQVF